MKSTGTAYLLWIIGCHRFYLGRPISNLLLWASCFVGVGFIWYVVDLFLIPGMVREENAKAFGVVGVAAAAVAGVESANQNAQNIVINMAAPVAPVVEKNDPGPESAFPGVADKA